MGVATFEWGEGMISVMSKTNRTRLNLEWMQQTIGLYDLPAGVERAMTMTALLYLAHVKDTLGDIGYTLPSPNSPKAELEAYVEWFLEADESLMQLWDDSIIKARNQGNDPDLVPSEAVEKNE